jgi:hypothetical protein
LRINNKFSYLFYQKKRGSLNDLLILAIQNDNIDFVKLFIENGCVISDFLTYRHLIKLYNKIPTNSILYELLMRNKRSKKAAHTTNDSVFELKEVGEVLRFLIDSEFIHQFLKKPLKNLTSEGTKMFLNGEVISFILFGKKLSI